MSWEIADRDHPDRAGPRFASIGDPALASAMERARPLGRFYVRWVTDDDRGHIHDGPSKPCKACAAVGRLTWLDDDGTCRRADVHRR